jgi:hypothetical protein
MITAEIMPIYKMLLTLVVTLLDVEVLLGVLGVLPKEMIWLISDIK